ncbi:ABC transporter ATP-binding protein [Petralouisia muris]|uniref:ABC transporter ATP-binding protein n=1 Tax=Petralouisia muris TaxID=3032872 RepID=A0AC61S1N8_9FIRM|nr:ABC transporter ATP-binding protein [Petralouisia muris]TGY97948.1 ABC transporter ATP-binding protein [Petralouisia muris]
MLELKLDRVSRHYKQKIAVDRLEFTFGKGIYGLLGANGAGKTTLLRMMVGVLKPTSGEILCDGQEIGKMAGEYRRKLGYLPQDLGYYPNFTVWRYLEYLAELKAVPPELAVERIEKLLQFTGLAKSGKEKIKTLSGGMIRRMGIAQSLLNDPEILILDEPTSGLDPRERIRFRNMISALGRDRMVLLSSHIVSDIEYIADEILIMKGGKITESGNLQKILKTVEGNVWECVKEPEQAELLNQQFTVSNLKNTEDGKVVLRIVSDTQPVEGAVRIPPNLEDVYLYGTREKSFGPRV